MISARHAGMAEAVVRWLASFSGWIVRPEVSFSRYGERGVIDLVAVTGYYTMLAMVLNVTRVELPDGKAPPLQPLP